MIERIDINASFIPLTQDQVTIVDTEDYGELIINKWHAQHNAHLDGYYAARREYLGEIEGKEKWACNLMHRKIMDAPKGKVVDHINHNPLDNRKSNLRIVSTRQNLQNQKRKTTSKYPGVSWAKHAQKWTARINMGEKYQHLGYFEDEREAAKTYERVCRALGEELVCKT